MDTEQKKNRTKKIIILIAVVWSLILLGAIIFFIVTIGKVRISVEYAPYAAKVELNGVSVWNHHENYITPGEYQVTVSFENFETYETTVSIDENTKFIFGTLTASNDEGRQYIESHLNEYSAINKFASAAANQFGQEQRATYPIIDKLPIKNPYYTIGYNFTNDAVLNVTIESGIAYRQLAVNKILEILSPEDFAKYDIKFYNLGSPYAGKFKPSTASDPAEYIKKGFADTKANFTVESGQIEGNYYYAYLRYFYNKNISVVYRIVLLRDGASWLLASEPYPLLTTFNTPDVPLEILNKVNSL